MNREIKFEYGFQSISGIIKKVYSIDQIHRISEICDIWNQLPVLYVREYSGIEDKNGKPIFEGDIVTVSYGTQWSKHKALEYVIFEDGQFMTNEGHKLGRKGTEVVGNIYEKHKIFKS